jgi:chorismate mutase/prephenate dehydratase
MNDDERLQEIRQRIDGLDEQIQRLVNDRARAAQEVARIKLAADSRAHFYRPEREAEILRTVKERNQGPLDDETVALLFREIMSACLALEQRLDIAFLGPEGTYTQAAAMKHFGHAVRTVSMASIPDVFREVQSGNCHYGVVPVENSTEGVISHTLDMFMRSTLWICGEVTLRIHHHLLSRAQRLDEVKKVYSHQQSLAQCRGWLDRNLPHAERIALGSNAEAARVAAEEPAAAAIAGEAAAEIYGMSALVHNVEDEPDNTTRFLVIGTQETGPSGRDKTSLLLSCRNKAGGLHALLTPLAQHGISMTRIESRPSRAGLWDYVFFIDVQGHRDDPSIAAALRALQAEAQLFKVLGSYPIAEL